MLATIFVARLLGLFDRWITWLYVSCMLTLASDYTLPISLPLNISIFELLACFPSSLQSSVYLYFTQNTTVPLEVQHDV